MMGLKYSQDDLKAIIDDIDQDGNGVIEFEEFVMLTAR